jgi:hypothetical protein
VTNTAKTDNARLVIAAGRSGLITGRKNPTTIIAPAMPAIHQAAYLLRWNTAVQTSGM